MNRLYKNGRIIMILCLGFLMNNAVFSQVQFEKLYGGSETESAADILQTSDGGYLIAGHTRTYGPGISGLYILKTDASGDVVWSQTVGGPNSEESYSIIEAPGGGYVVAGYTTSFGSGNEDMYLVKISETGDVQWTKTYGGAGIDIAREVISTSDGGFLVAGYTNSFNNSFFDMYLVKTNNRGDVEWTKMYGGTGFDNARSVRQAKDGGYLVVGQKAASNGGDIWLIKTDGNGDMQWEKTYGGSGLDEGKYIQLTTDGGYIMIGDYNVFGPNSSDVYVIKTDQSGTVQWTKTFGGNDKDVGKTIEPVSSGGYIIASITRSFGLGTPDAWLIRLNSSGTKMWDRKFGKEEHDHGHSVIETSDGGFAMVGHANQISGNLEDIYFVKTNSLGTVSIQEAMASSDMELNVFPNPAVDRIRIEIPEEFEKALVELVDIGGRTVIARNNLITSTTDFSIDHLNRGVYFIRLTSGKNTRVKRVIFY